MGKSKFLFSSIFCLILLFFSCKNSDNMAYKAKVSDPENVHQGFRRVTDIIRHDIFSPPVASRIYAYTAVAAYEALIPGHPGYKTMAGQLNGLTPLPKPEPDQEYCFELASSHALLVVGKKLIFSEQGVEDLQDELLAEFEAKGVPKKVFERSVAFGEAVAQHIIDWSKGDNYAATRSMPRYSIQRDDPSRWVPTPPTHSDAIEPNWSKIRPWVMDSVGQFRPDPPFPFSKEKNSTLYKAMLEVYEASKTLDEDKKMVGLYWDCNPFEVEVRGHLMIPTKKITPGGHWINITAHACRKANRDLMQSTESYLLVSLGLSEAFLSCWTEKFSSNTLRPVTYINRYIDADWTPFIETPPFPEHTSGHATISASAATVLTQLFGEKFAFIDSTEMIFNMPPRPFNSFMEAADEVALSRFYGGIHLLHGNLSGAKSGKEIGNFVVKKISTK